MSGKNAFSTVFVRFNGVASENADYIRAAWDDKTAAKAVDQAEDELESAKISCSVFAGTSREGGQMSSEEAASPLYHLMIDAGQGVVRSLEQGIRDITARMQGRNARSIPDALLLSHGHIDHIADLNSLVKASKNDTSFNPNKKIQVYCTKETLDQITATFPALKSDDSILQYNIITPREKMSIGPFKVLPIASDHSTDKAKAESLAFIITYENTKIISGWDFRSLLDTDESLFWNPSLLILGTESYNPHPSVTGMISVSDAYNLARQWNAKEVFLLHYSGIADLEDGKNQWFMGPTKPMSLDELQNYVDKTLGITGAEGKFRITVAKQGMIWSSKEYHDRIREYYAETEAKSDRGGEQSIVGPHLEIEALQKYLLKFDSLDGGKKLRVTVEDKIKSFEPEFEYPIRNAEGTVLKAHPIRGMFAKGPEIRLMITENDTSAKSDPDMPERGLVDLNISKGKKSVFHDMIPVMKHDATRLMRYIYENFKISSNPLAA
jgi:hypothetical protein